MNTLRSKFTVHLIVYLLCFVMLLPLVAADNHAGDTPVSYHSQIVPILKRSCQGCHHPGDPNGGLIVTTYTDLKQGGMAGDATIVPGKPDDSLIIELISGDEPAMPQNMEPLSAEEVELFRRWIFEGANAIHPPKSMIWRRETIRSILYHRWLLRWHTRPMAVRSQYQESAKFYCMTQ